jgi:hypothetical protein
VLTIFAALIGDLIILPAMLACFAAKPKTFNAATADVTIEADPTTAAVPR